MGLLARCVALARPKGQARELAFRVHSEVGNAGIDRPAQALVSPWDLR